MAAEFAPQPPDDATGAAALEELILGGRHREALERCTRDHARGLLRLCMAMTGSRAEAEELTQETLLAAYQGFSGFAGEGSARAWLFGIARRLCGRHTELRHRREARLRLVHDLGRSPDAAELSLEHERAARARAALAELKPSEREAVLLRYQAGLSFREVAEACGIDEAAARKRVSRALGRLRAWVGDGDDKERGT